MKQIKIGSDTKISRDINLERYLKDIRKFEPLTYAEERSIILAAKTGNQVAHDKLISSNLRFVVSCAKEYQHPDIAIIDLISAGNVGLIEALRKFDLSKEVKFISYAVWWIKNAIIEYLKENVRAIHLPYNQQNDIKEYKKIKEKLEQELEINLNASQVEELTLGTSNEVNLKELQQALSCHNKATSINEPLGNGEDGEGIIEDLISDPESIFTSKYDTEHKRNFVHQVLNKLPQIQKEIMFYSFGINDGISRSNEDIAEQLGLTAERIRQIKGQTLLKLKEVEHLSNCF